MKINFDEFEEIAREYYELNCNNDTYIDSIPYDIRQFIFDNTYNTNNQKKSDMLLEKLFGVELFDWFQWFLWDAPLNSKENGDSPNITVDGRDYYIHNIDSFIEFVKIEYFNV